jgi:hypothetical protein
MEHTGKTIGEFSVCQFFADETYEYVRRGVGAEEAVKAFSHYINSVAAKLGFVERVIITDGGDCVNYEWQKGKGITYDGSTTAPVVQPTKEPSHGN